MSKKQAKKELTNREKKVNKMFGRKVSIEEVAKALGFNSVKEYQIWRRGRDKNK